jgi:stringent starvation protein B
MTSSRPYLVRAIYEWLVDNQLTPYIMVDTLQPDVQVPENYIEDEKIILNVAPMAVRDLSMTNTEIEFDARFSGINHHIYVPTQTIMAVYAFENGRGMVFSEEDDAGEEDREPPTPGQPPRSKGKPHLKVVK